MSLEIKMKSPKEIILNHNLEYGGKVHRFFTDTCYKHMDKYVPYDEGGLRRDVSFSVDGDAITYESPYARYQYYGKLMVMDNGKGAYYSPNYGFWSDKGKKKHLTNQDLTYHTAGTGPYWDKRMVDAEADVIAKEVEDYMKRGI